MAGQLKGARNPGAGEERGSQPVPAEITEVRRETEDHRHAVASVGRRTTPTLTNEHGNNSMVDTDRITGAAKELGGKVQGAVGDLTGSQRDSLEGRAREAQGTAENLYGQAKDTVRDAAEHVADAARDIGGRVRDTVGDLIGSDDVEDRARRAQGAAADTYDRAERYVRSTGRDAYERAEDAYETGGRSLRRGGREATHQIAEHPVAALIVAGLLGYGLGLLIHGRD